MEAAGVLLKGDLLASTDEPEALAQAMLRLMNLSKGAGRCAGLQYIEANYSLTRWWWICGRRCARKCFCERYSGGMKLNAFIEQAISAIY